MVIVSVVTTCMFPAPLGGGGGVDTSGGVAGGSGKSWAWFGKGACPRLLKPAALCHSGSFNMPDAHTHSWLIASEFLAMAPSDWSVAPGRSGVVRKDPRVPHTARRGA